MRLTKHLLKGSMVCAGMLAAVPAWAAHYTFNGLPNGTFHQIASTTFITAGGPLVCTWDGAVVVTNGMAKSTTVVLTGGAACAQSSACPGSLPWLWAPPTSDAGPGNVVIPVCVVVSSPAGGMNCSGNILGTLNNAGQFSFTANLSPNCTWKSTAPSAPSPLDAIYP